MVACPVDLDDGRPGHFGARRTRRGGMSPNVSLMVPAKPFGGGGGGGGGHSLNGRELRRNYSFDIIGPRRDYFLIFFFIADPSS